MFKQVCANTFFFTNAFSTEHAFTFVAYVTFYKHVFVIRKLSRRMGGGVKGERIRWLGPVVFSHLCVYNSSVHVYVTELLLNCWTDFDTNCRVCFNESLDGVDFQVGSSR